MKSRVGLSLERRAQRRSAHRRLWIGVSAGAAVAVVALVLVTQGHQPQAPLGSITAAEGQVRFSENSRDWRSAHPGDKVADPVFVVTDERSRAQVGLADARVVLAASSRARLARSRRSNTPSSVEVQLLNGEASFSVKPRESQDPLLVLVGGYTVRVVGTEFTIRTGPGKSVQVIVQEGTVEVVGPSTHLLVHRGESWTSDAPSASPHPADRNSPAAGPPAPPSADAAEPKEAFQPATRPAKSARSVAMTVSKEPEPPSAVARADLAQELLRKGRRAEALSLYQSLAKGDGPRAELSLYEVARLRREMGDKVGALTAFQEYRTRFAGGMLRQEADLSIIELQLESSSFDQALSSIDQFIAQYPQNERRAEVLLLRADVNREKGNCRSALKDYEALDHHFGATGERALYFSALCSRMLGDEIQARSKLTEYLTRFPGGAHQAAVRRALEGGETFFEGDRP